MGCELLKANQCGYLTCHTDINNIAASHIFSCRYRRENFRYTSSVVRLIYATLIGARDHVAIVEFSVSISEAYPPPVTSNHVA